MPWEDQVRVYGSGGDRDPDEPMSPGGESLRSFDLRARTALQRLIDVHGRDSVAVVTHGGFITATMLALLGHEGLANKRAFVLDPGYTSLTEWAQEDRFKPWVLHRYNDTGHLARIH
jgi:broad specificity phosphatase PhoE